MDPLNELDIFLITHFVADEQLALNSSPRTLLLWFGEVDITKRLCWSSWDYVMSLWREVF